MKTAALFEALGGGTRFAIVSLLMRKGAPLPVGEINKEVGGSIPTTSRALNHLLRVGAVERQIKLNQRLYSVKPEVACLVEQARQLTN